MTVLAILLWNVGGELLFRIGIFPNENLGGVWILLCGMVIISGLTLLQASVGLAILTIIAWIGERLEKTSLPEKIRRVVGHSEAVMQLLEDFWWLIALIIVLLGFTTCKMAYDLSVSSGLLPTISKKGWLATFQGHTAGVPSLAFSPEGMLLASGSLDSSVRLWEVDTGKNVAILQGHNTRVNAIAFSPDGKLLASGDGSIWSPTPPLHFSAPRKNKPVQTSTPKQELHLPYSVVLWDVATGAQKARLVADTKPILTVAFSPDGKSLAAGGGWMDGQKEEAIWIWDVVTGDSRIKWRRDFVWSVAFSPDGTLLAAGQINGISLLTVEPNPFSTRLKVNQSIKGLAYSPDGAILAPGSNDNLIRLWDVAEVLEQ